MNVYNVPKSFTYLFEKLAFRQLSLICLAATEHSEALLQNVYCITGLRLYCEPLVIGPSI